MIHLDATIHPEAGDVRVATWLRSQGIAPDVTRAIWIGRFFIRAEQCRLDGEGREFLSGDDLATEIRWFRRRTPFPSSLVPR